MLNRRLRTRRNQFLAHSISLQDLLRRMLKLDPNERASIPEIFSHSWLRFRNVTSLDAQVSDDSNCIQGLFCTQSLYMGSMRCLWRSCRVLLLHSCAVNCCPRQHVILTEETLVDNDSTTGHMIGAADRYTKLAAAAMMVSRQLVTTGAPVLRHASLLQQINFLTRLAVHILSVRAKGRASSFARSFSG